MIETETIEVKKEEVRTKKVFCSFCGKEFDERTTECNGYGSLNFYFGFGSCFDDSRFSLEICDFCFIDKFGDPLHDQCIEKGIDLEYIKSKVENNIK
jgi:hypothetical protein